MDLRRGLIGGLAVAVPVGVVAALVIGFVRPDGSLTWVVWAIAAAAWAGGFVYEGSDDT